MFTIKPIDKEAIIKAAGQTGAIVTAENHNAIGGLGSAVAEVLVENRPVPQERIGIKEVFGQVAPTPWLMDEYQISAKFIVEAAKKVISRK